MDPVYLTPERHSNTGGELQYPFTKLTKERRIGLVAIDEAYLVRSWVSLCLIGTVNQLRSLRVKYQNIQSSLMH